MTNPDWFRISPNRNSSRTKTGPYTDLFTKSHILNCHLHRSILPHVRSLGNVPKLPLEIDHRSNTVALDPAYIDLKYVTRERSKQFSDVCIIAMKLAIDRVDIALQEPLARELKLEVKSQLDEYWEFHRRDIMFRRNTKLSWLLTENMTTLDNPDPQLKPIILGRFCNKPTALYLLASGRRNNCCPTIILGCIYINWFLCYINNPNFEFGRFFADPVRITSTGPQAVADIVRSHNSLCDQASQFLTKVDRGEEFLKYYRLTTQTYKLLLLCRAIILVLDELDEDVEEDEDGRISLDEYSQAQSVLMSGLEINPV